MSSIGRRINTSIGSSPGGTPDLLLLFQRKRKLTRIIVSSTAAQIWRTDARMTYSKQDLWSRFQKYYAEFPSLGLCLDLSRMKFSDDFFSEMEPRLQKAFAAMASLEKGAIANPDENRMVGHYWLRNPALAPTPEIRKEIEETIESIKGFATQIHAGKLQGASGPFKNLLLIGIGGSALGPQFVANALSQPAADKLAIYFFDNTDPDGMDNILSQIRDELGRTLCIVVSKSGGTKETRNGMLEAEAAFRKRGLKERL